MADVGVQTEHEYIADDALTTKSFQSVYKSKPMPVDLEHKAFADQILMGSDVNTFVRDASFTNNLDLLDQNVEYDDDAILIMNPDLKEAVERRQSLLLDDSRNSGSRNSMEAQFAAGDRSSRYENVDQMTERIVEDLRIGYLEKVQKAADNIKTMKNSTASLKTEYAELKKRVKTTALHQRRILRTANGYDKDLDLVIYQQTIIKHLEEAARQMKLFECHVTSDRKLIMIDPEEFGTDVDAQAQVTDFQANVIVDREFHKETTDGGKEEAWDLF